jgi:hypothetical protein
VSSHFVEIFDGEVPQKVSIMSRYLDKSWKVSTNLKNLDSLDENLDAAKSQLKSLDFKNLDEKKKDDLDRRENLDTVKKLVSTLRTFSIPISIGLDCRDHQAYYLVQDNHWLFWLNYQAFLG